MAKINKIVTDLNTAMANLSKTLDWDEEELFYMQSFFYQYKEDPEDIKRAFNTNIQDLTDFEILFLNMKEYFDEMIRQERMKPEISSERLFQLNYLASIASMGSQMKEQSQRVGEIAEALSYDPNRKVN